MLCQALTLFLQKSWPLGAQQLTQVGAAVRPPSLLFVDEVPSGKQAAWGGALEAPPA